MITEFVVANTESYSTPSNVTVVVSGTWYEESSPPVVVTTITTGSSGSFAYAGVAKNNGPRAMTVAVSNLPTLFNLIVNASWGLDV